MDPVIFNRLVAIAKIDYLFNRPLAKFLLKFVFGLTVISLIFVFLSTLFIFLEPFKPWALSVILVGLLVLPAYAFVFFYLKDYDQGHDLGLELVRALAKINKEADLGSIIKVILETNSGQLFLSEIDDPNGDIVKMLLSEVKPQNVESILEGAKVWARQDGRNLVLVGDFLMTILHSAPGLSGALLRNGFDEDDLLNIIYWVNLRAISKIDQIGITDRLKYTKTSFAEGWSSGYTPVLDRFGREITGHGGGFSIEGREQAIDIIENSLSRDSKSNCILVGPLGSGKSTLVKGFASRIFWGQALPALAHLRVIQIDISAIISSASNNAELESLVMSIMNEATTAGNVIIFIDDIHQVFTGGNKAGSVDISQIIVPYLESSAVKIIGATTNSYYETYISAKPTIKGAFSKVEIEPTDKKTTIRIMQNLAEEQGYRRGIFASYPAIKEIYHLSERYIQGKEFPSRAVDLMTDIFTAAKNQKIAHIDKHIAERLSAKIMSIPTEQAEGGEKEKLLNLEATIHQRMIGQEFAVNAVSDAMRRARTKTQDSKKPAGSFLFLGPTGVGKTELAKSLAEAYFGAEKNMTRLDMSEYQDIGAIGRLLGKKRPGSEELEGGDFVKQVREKPFSLVLLDEIEKAHPNVLDIFLQVLDEGYLTDGMGEKVIFTNCLIVATSNAGSEIIRESIKDKSDYDAVKNLVLDELQKNHTYRAEFLNRFDGVIIFNPLSREEILRIAVLIFESIRKNFENKGYQIVLAPDLLNRLAEDGFQPELGARHLKRVFQDKIESYLAKKILADELGKEGETVIGLEDIYGQKNE